MRAISSRTISFGLVSIPIKIYSPKDTSEKISFRMLNGKTKGRLRQQYVDAQTGEVVSRGDIVKGYEFRKDEFVIFTEEEIKAVEAEASSEIEITEFVPLSAVDPVLFESVYYLGPDKGGDRAYLLLSRALQETELAAVAQYAARGKEYLVILRPNEHGGLILQQLRYPEEVRAFDEVPIKEGTEVKDAELQLALQLIKASAKEEFDAEKYVDSVKGRLQEAIQRKVEGHEVAVAPAEEPKARVIDLMEALKASLAEAQGGGGRKPAKAATPGSGKEKKGASTS
jgi:DNA end-binding protein Ku